MMVRGRRVRISRRPRPRYTVEALEGLAQIGRTSDIDAAKVAAWWVVPQFEISGS